MAYSISYGMMLKAMRCKKLYSVERYRFEDTYVFIIDLNKLCRRKPYD